MQSPFIRGKIQSALHGSSVTVTVLLLQEKKERICSQMEQQILQETIVGQATPKKSSYLKSISEVKCRSKCHKTDVQVSWKTGSLR